MSPIRGYIDIIDLKYVINYELPYVAEDLFTALAEQVALGMRA